MLWDRQEGEDCHDLIEWLADQDWCTGKVAMSGTSYLAVSQWFTAAEQPPHLAAINPWEGVSDVYRDLVMRGGMPDTGFARQLQDGSFCGKSRKEDILAEAERYPLMNALWENKIPRFDQITVPAYVVASYSNTLHTAGTFRAWRRIAFGTEVAAHPQLAGVARLLRRGEQGRSAPLLRPLPQGRGQRLGADARAFATRCSTSKVATKSIWPRTSSPRTASSTTKYYLDGRSRTLRTEVPTEEVTAAYDADSNPGLVSFIARFDEETVMVGYPKAQLWVEAEGADDMDLFVLVQKLDAHGTPLQEFTVPNQARWSTTSPSTARRILRYKGSDGRLRVSMRHLDETLSTDEVPAHSFDRVEKLTPGEVVEVEIDLLPIGLVFHPGEQLRFVVSAQNLLANGCPRSANTPAEQGQARHPHRREHASYLQLPVQTVV